MELSDLADKYRSDKGTQFGHAHHYTNLYAFLFEQFREQAFAMLEIGLEQGGIESGAAADRKVTAVPSVRMWQDYFPNATVFDFDISDFSEFSDDRFKFVRGDSGIVGELEHLERNLPLLRIIVDDGSHASFHQQLAFYKLFNRVEPGGYYIIEDFHWQPPFEKSLPVCEKTENVFVNFTKDRVLRLPFGSPDIVRGISSQIDQIYIHRNNKGGVDCWKTKMIAIRKSCV